MSRIHSESQQHPSYPVERILICHPKLPEKCLNGKSLSEDAEIEEIAEQIFLYHPEVVEPKNFAWKQEAVQFLGLCVALYALPTSLKQQQQKQKQQQQKHHDGDDDNDGETTKEVYLGKSTLVFVPLEQNDEILAVIQLRRGRGNPIAVRQSIEKCHSLFELFHGGGILHRLKQRRRNNNNDDNCEYPGMDRLYSLRREIRKHKTKQSRLSTNDPDAASYGILQEQIDKLGQELDQLQQKLPIESIRQDLSSHYNEYLDNLTLVTSRQGGGLRCLVDCVPAPIAQDSGRHTVKSSPSRLSNDILFKLKTDIQHILLQDKNDQPILFGISTFYMGHLVQSDFFGNDESTDMDAEAVTTIMGYMASYRIKLQQNAHWQGNSMTSPLRLGKLASSIVYHYQGHSDQSSFASSSPKNGIPTTGGAFLVPPPSFMMSTSEGNQSIDIQNEQLAWAPKLNLSIECTQGTEEQTSQTARVLLYTIGDFEFLIFLHNEPKLGLQSDVERDMVSNALMNVRDKLDAAVTMASSQTSMLPPSPASSKDSQKTNLGEPGVDFILIDRKQHELTLYTDPKVMTSNNIINNNNNNNKSNTPSKNKPHGNGGASPRKLFGFMSPPKRKVPSQQDEKKATSQTREWSVLGLDCRHLLASHLHLDVLLAFDDMMNDIATKRDAAADSSRTAKKYYVELCTCMTLGWVYGCANQDMELYAFFDNSTYVTVSDVQNTVKRIKEKSFAALNE
ncbi:MAG: hypothetical protein SGBAC_005081 [Bacillariaceae sp.]